MFVKESKKLRVLTVWRRNLIHVNRSAESHFQSYDNEYDFTLLLPKNAELNEELKESFHRLVVLNDYRLSMVGFYISVLLYVYKYRSRFRWNVVIGGIGEEIIAWFLKRSLLREARLVYDLWDIPGTNVHKNLGVFKSILWEVYRYLLDHILKGGDIHIVGVMKEGLRRFGIKEETMIVSENGVDLKKLDRAENCCEDAWEDMRAKKGGRLIYVGSIAEERGVLDMLKVTRRLLDDGKEVSAIIVGQSDDYSKKMITKMVDKLELRKIVTVLGWQSYKKVISLIQGADIALCPLHDIEQYRWSYPVKVYEYMALGKPVVASDLPGTIAVAPPGICAYYFKAGNLGEFYSCLTNLLVNENERMRLGLNGVAQARKKERSGMFKKLINDLTKRLNDLETTIKK